MCSAGIGWAHPGNYLQSVVPLQKKSTLVLMEEPCSHIASPINLLFLFYNVVLTREGSICTSVLGQHLKGREM